MYIIPRFIGVFTYALVLIVVCIVITKSNKRSLGKILFVYTIILSFMGYKFIPAPGNDLYRLFDVLEFYGGQTMDTIWSMMKEGSTPMNTLYFHLIGKIGLKGLLPAITTFIFYSNIFYIFKKFSKKYNISSLNVSIGLFFFMSTGSFFEVISGIRTMLGFSIVAVCFYKEIEEDKSIVRNLIWYIIAGLIHSAVLAAIVLRFVFLGFQVYEKKNEKIKIVILGFTIIPILLIWSVNFLNMMVNKMLDYITVSEGHSYFWEYLIGVIILFLTILILKDKKFKINIGKEIKIINNLKFLKLVLLIVWIAFFIEYNTFHRFIIFATVFFTPIIMLFCELRKKESQHKIRIILLISIILLVIASIRGNLCSLKFFI